MTKWQFIEITSEVAACICSVIGFFASVKNDEDLDDRVRRIMLEDKTGRQDERRDTV